MWRHEGRTDTQTHTHTPGIEAPPFAGTAFPMAAVPRILFRLDVEIIDMVHQVLKGVEEQVALRGGGGGVIRLSKQELQKACMFAVKNC